MNDRAIVADVIRGVVAIAVVTGTVILGLYDVVDAAAATGILGAVIGAVGATGAAAVGGRAAHNQGDE